MKHEAPPFPNGAILAKVTEGHVRAVMTFDEKGMVADVRIVSSDPTGVFDGSLRDTLLKWQCAANGSKYRASIQMNFALKGEAPQAASGTGVALPSSPPGSIERQERDAAALAPAIAVLVKKYESAQPVAPAPDAERVALAREIIDVSGTREKIALVVSPGRVEKPIGGQPASSRVPSKLRDAARQAGLAECLFSLRDLSDADFDKWLEFLRTDSGGRYARGVNTALREAYLEAAEVYARTLVDVARQLKGRGGT